MAKKTTKTTRNMKVLEQSGYKYKPTPAIMLKGQWLAEFGFEIFFYFFVDILSTNAQIVMIEY